MLIDTVGTEAKPVDDTLFGRRAICSTFLSKLCLETSRRERRLRAIPEGTTRPSASVDVRATRGGRCWNRTSDLFDVNEVLFH